jgi:WXG100 family type VII secretion target
MPRKPIRVKRDALDDAVAGFDVHHRDLLGVLSQLETDLAPMIESWDGEAQATYLEKQKAWNKGATDLAELLGVMRRTTLEAHDGYEETVQAVRGLWS